MRPPVGGQGDPPRPVEDHVLEEIEEHAGLDARQAVPVAMRVDEPGIRICDPSPTILAPAKRCTRRSKGPLSTTSSPATTTPPSVIQPPAASSGSTSTLHPRKIVNSWLLIVRLPSVRRRSPLLPQGAVIPVGTPRFRGEYFRLTGRGNNERCGLAHGTQRWRKEAKQPRQAGGAVARAGAVAVFRSPRSL